MKFFNKDFSVNVTKSVADLDTFTEEILNEKLRFLYSDLLWLTIINGGEETFEYDTVHPRAAAYLLGDHSFSL